MSDLDLQQRLQSLLQPFNNYRAFASLWANADVELQPQVADVKRRIDRLFVADARKR